MNITRRAFLGSLAISGTAVAAEKVFDGGFADVSEPGVPNRVSPDGTPAPVMPAGAHAASRFAAKCVGCQACVSACPNQVLHAGGFGTGFRPYMGFEHGWCRTDCNICSTVCPAGAIEPIELAYKKDYHVGVAVWNEKACLAAQEGVNCHACARHCPTKAITLVNHLPVVDEVLCIGCGACENHCPARPQPGMWVRGLKVHRETLPMDRITALEEAVTLLKVDAASCVLIKDGVIVAHEKGPGVRPLLGLYDKQPELLKGATVVDKVIGRAAASIAALGGANEVYGLVASEGARDFCIQHNLDFSAETLVPQILNRKRDGMCPLENAVKDLSDPPVMLAALRARIAELMAAKK